MFGTILKRVLGNDFFKNTLVLGSSTFVAQAISMCIIPILTRVYSPGDFGILQTFQYVVIYFISISCLKFDAAVLIPKENSGYRKVLASGIVSVLAVSIFSAISVGVLKSLKFFPLFLQEISSYLWFIPIVTIVSGFFLLFSSVLIRMKRFGTLGKSKIFQTGGVSIIQLALGTILKYDSIGLILGDVGGRLSGLLSYSKTIFLELKKTIPFVNRKDIKETFMTYRRFPLLTTPGAILNISGYAIPVLLFGSFYGTTALGFYTLVNTLFTAPVVLIGTSVSQVFSSDTSLLFQENPKNLYSLFISIIKKLTFLSFGPVVILLLVAPQLFSLVFGESWENSGHYFRVLAPLQFFGFIVGPLTPTLNLIGEQKWQFIWEILRFSSSVILMIFVYFFSPKAIEALLYYSLIMAFFYIVHAIMSLYFIKRRIDQLDNTLIK